MRVSIITTCLMRYTLCKYIQRRYKYILYIFEYFNIYKSRDICAKQQFACALTSQIWLTTICWHWPMSPPILESAGHGYNRASFEYCHEYCVHRTALFFTHNEICIFHSPQRKDFTISGINGTVASTSRYINKERKCIYQKFLLVYRASLWRLK